VIVLELLSLRLPRQAVSSSFKDAGTWIGLRMRRYGLP
jgi:hypothetical protein